MKFKLLKRKRCIVVIFMIYAVFTYYAYCYISSRAERFKKDCLQYYANVVEKILLTNIQIITQTINNNDSNNVVEIIANIVRNDFYLYNNTHLVPNNKNLIPLNFLEILVDAGNNFFDLSIKINDIEIANSSRNKNKEYIKNVYKINSTDSITI